MKGLEGAKPLAMATSIKLASTKTTECARVEGDGVGKVSKWCPWTLVSECSWQVLFPVVGQRSKGTQLEHQRPDAHPDAWSTGVLQINSNTRWHCLSPIRSVRTTTVQGPFLWNFTRHRSPASAPSASSFQHDPKQHHTVQRSLRWGGGLVWWGVGWGGRIFRRAGVSGWRTRGRCWLITQRK